MNRSDYNAVAFETERLYFRAFERSDLDALAALSADEVGSRYVGDGQPLDRETTASWIENSRRNVAQYGYGTGALVLKASAALIGWAGIARPGDGTEEIIYGLDRAVWGQGLGTELLSAMVDWAGNELGIEPLRATVHPANEPSIRMLRRAGFVLSEASYQGDALCDLYCRFADQPGQHRGTG